MVGLPHPPERNELKYDGFRALTPPCVNPIQFHVGSDVVGHWQAVVGLSCTNPAIDSV
jgi:hypothetical protein